MKRFIDKYVDSLFLKGIEKTQSIMSEDKNEHLPKCLFKFFPPTINSLINLQNQQLHLSSPKNFNDPFDSYVCIEDQTFIKLYILDKLKKNNLISKENINKTISKDEYWEIYHSWSNGEENYSRIRSFSITIFKILENKSESLRNTIRSFHAQAHRECSRRIEYIRNLSFKIACFSSFKDASEIEKNTTMWSHYSNNHKGFCVKYSLNIDDSKYKDAISCGLFPVIYTSKIPKISPRELIKLRYSEKELVLSKSILKTTMKTLITKSKFWSYEKEWRLIVSNENMEILTNNTIPFPNVESIYMGYKIQEGLRIALVKFAELNGVSVFQAKQNNEKFELYFYPVTSKSIKEDIFYYKLHKFNKIENDTKRSKRISKLYEEFDI